LLAEDEKEKFQTSSLYSETFKRFEYQPVNKTSKTPSPNKDDSSKDQKLNVKIRICIKIYKEIDHIKTFFTAD